MTILENTQLPKGTVLELEGNMNFELLKLEERAIVQANQICVSGYPTIELPKQAELRIDTITGEGTLSVLTYLAKFEYDVNLLNGKIRLFEHKEAWYDRGMSFEPSWSKAIRNEMVNGEPVTKERYEIWSHTLAVDGSIGIREGNTPKDANSPFLQNNTLSFNLGMSTYFRLNNRWGLSTGIQWNGNRKTLSHQVKYENDKLVVIDGQGEFQRNKLVNDYVGIPIELYYYLGKRHTESLSLGLYGARLVGERLNTSKDLTKLFGFATWTGEKVDIFNPWKLELGLSFNTQHLGIIHGVRVFTNILPEYKPGVTTDKFRSIGLEFKL